VDHPIGLLDDEVVDEGAVACEGLGAHAGAARGEIGLGDLGDERGARAGEGDAAEGSPLLRNPRAPVLARHLPEAGPAGDLERVAHVEARARVALAREGEHGVGAGLDAALDATGEVHAEEGERRVGNRVDEVSHEVSPFRREHPVLAAERDDRHVDRHPGHPRHPVAPEARAGDEDARLEVARGGLGDDALARPHDARDHRALSDLAAAVLDLACVRRRHLPVVHDPRLGHEERRHAGHVRLALVQLVRRDAADAGEAIRASPALDLLQTRSLRGGGGDDHLPTSLEGHAVLLAEAFQ